MEHYKKTFVGMQVFIALVTAALFVLLHRLWIPAVTFFVMMQVGALVGALWATRLKRLRSYLG